MFTELKPLLKQRVVMITVSDIGEGLLRVNIIPRKLGDGDSEDNAALTTPLTVTGKAEELDRDLPSQLASFTESIAKSGSNLEQRAFPASALHDIGYRGVWLGERSWNGVAILARECDPVLTRSSLPGNPEDHQARYIEAAVNGVLITSIYLPNGNPHPGPKFDYKLAWFERLIEHAAELMKAGVPVVLAGDYNVVPAGQDIYPTRSLDSNALIQPQSRQAYARLLTQGWTDALRKLQPEGPLWTFWDYERNRWPSDKGMRLDHLLLSPTVCDRLVDGGVDRWVRGEENASDHAPAWIVLDG